MHTWYRTINLLFFQVSSKIIHVSSGSEVKEHVKSLYEYFETVGSPVMIGHYTHAYTSTCITGSSYGLTYMYVCIHSHT